MPLGLPLAIASTLGTAAALLAHARSRREMDLIEATVENGGMIAHTSVGTIEFPESGGGEPLLMIRGAGGGFDRGLLIGPEFADGFTIIAPSPFGHLGTRIPQDSSPAAQADAHAALLDYLEIKRCVVAGASAGAPSVIEFALRYPERASALILLAPRAYDPTDPVGVDEQVLQRGGHLMLGQGPQVRRWPDEFLARSVGREKCEAPRPPHGETPRHRHSPDALLASHGG